MIELVVNESFPLKKDKSINVVASIARQWGMNCAGLSSNTFCVPAVFEFTFYCRNRCDYPHLVAADGHKWVMCALVAAGVLQRCGWKQVGGFVDTFHIDKEDPRVVVRID